jgi:hypothetical protein
MPVTTKKNEHARKSEQPRGLAGEINTLRILKDEALIFEIELRSYLRELKNYGANKVLDAPSRKRVTICGLNGIGVIAADDIVVQIDKNEAKAFVDKSAYSEIESKSMKEGVTAQDICDMISKDPKLLSSKLSHFAPIFKVLSESGIQVSELSAKSRDELEEKGGMFVEQHWIVSQVRDRDSINKSLKAVVALKAVMEEIVEAVKDPERISTAFHRYGIKGIEIPILPKKVEVKEVESPSVLHKRELNRIPPLFKEKLASGKSFGDTVNEMLQIANQEEVIKKLGSVGMVEEAQRVDTYLRALKSTKANVRKLISDWVEKGVPKQEELLKSAESIGMNKDGFEKAIEIVVVGITAEKAGATKRKQNWEEKLKQFQYADEANQANLREFRTDEERTMERCEKMTKAAEEALKILKSE